MISVRVVAGIVHDDTPSHAMADRIRVQAWESFGENHLNGRTGQWITLAYYKLEERERALACAKQVEQLPSMPLQYLGEHRPACILYETEAAHAAR
jgi:hypothetical protein